MAKLLTSLFLLIGLSAYSQSDDTTRYLKYPNSYGQQLPRIWGTKVMRPPTDTMSSKSGIAVVGSTLYVGNGTYWSTASVDSLGLAAKLNIADTSSKWLTTVYRRNDSVFTKKGAASEVFAFKDSTGGAANAWNKDGNPGTIPGTDFIGPTDSTDLVFKINGTRHGWIGRVGGLAFGKQALDNSDAILINTAYGGSTLQYLTTAEHNTAVGYGALRFSNGNYNTAVGAASQPATTTGINNTSVGTYSMLNNTTGFYNTAVGFAALLANTTGEQNAAFGMNALMNNTTGIKNTGIGPAAGENITTGSFNTPVGHDALLSLRRGSYNSALGWLAGPRDTSIYNEGNVTIGVQSGRNVFYGKYSTFIGTNAGFHASQQDSVDYSVAIGADAYTEYSNQLRIADNINRVTFPGLASGASFDTTNNKPSAMNSSGDIVKMGYWPGAGAHFYQNNGTFTSNRTGTLGNYFLRFNGMVSTNGTTSMTYNNGSPILEMVGDGDDVGPATIKMTDLSNSGAEFNISAFYGAGNLTASQGGSSGSLGLSPGSFYLNSSLSGLVKTINGGTGSAIGIKVTDGEDSTGLVYEYVNADSAIARAGDNWIPHRGYVQRVIDSLAATVGGGGVTDHGALTGLSDDDHTQYPLLTGRSGGQTLIGGTGTTDDLVLQSTSGVGATGAEIQFKVGNNGATQAMAILNNGNVGIGVSSPSVVLHTNSTAANGYSGYDVGMRVQGNNPAIQFLNSAGSQGWQFDYQNSTGNFILRTDAGTEYFKVNRISGDFEIKPSNSPANIKLAWSGTSYFNTGDFSIGSSTSTSKFNIGASHQFQVNSTGNIVKLNNVTTSFPSSQGTANTVIENDGSGNLSWVKRSAIPMFDFYTDAGNSGSGNTDVYSSTLSSYAFTANGNKLIAEYSGTAAASVTGELSIYFGDNGSTSLLTTVATDFASGVDWSIQLTMIRVSNTTLRWQMIYSDGGTNAAKIKRGEMTGLSMDTDSQQIKLNLNGDASNDIIAKMGVGIWYPTM